VEILEKRELERATMVGGCSEEDDGSGGMGKKVLSFFLLS
jgi:hypothetical protein